MKLKWRKCAPESLHFFLVHKLRIWREIENPKHSLRYVVTFIISNHQIRTSHPQCKRPLTIQRSPIELHSLKQCSDTFALLTGSPTDRPVSRLPSAKASSHFKLQDHRADFLFLPISSSRQMPLFLHSPSFPWIAFRRISSNWQSIWSSTSLLLVLSIDVFIAVVTRKYSRLLLFSKPQHFQMELAI